MKLRIVLKDEIIEIRNVTEKAPITIELIGEEAGWDWDVQTLEFDYEKGKFRDVTKGVHRNAGD